MSYNTKEKPICSCRDGYISKKKECHRNWLYQQLFESSNRKVFLSNTVILL